MGDVRSFLNLYLIEIDHKRESIGCNELLDALCSNLAYRLTFKKKSEILSHGGRLVYSITQWTLPFLRVFHCAWHRSGFEPGTIRLSRKVQPLSIPSVSPNYTFTANFLSVMLFVQNSIAQPGLVSSALGFFEVPEPSSTPADSSVKNVFVISLESRNESC